MGAGVTALRLTAADVAARGAQPEVEAAATLLAAVGQWCRHVRGNMLAGVGGREEALKQVHAATVGDCRRRRCKPAHSNRV